MGATLGLVTWTVRMSSASTTGGLSLKEVNLIEIKWKVGSLGFAEMIAVAATADAAPTRAELQLQLRFFPIFFAGGRRKEGSVRF